MCCKSSETINKSQGSFGGKEATWETEFSGIPSMNVAPFIGSLFVDKARGTILLGTVAFIVFTIDSLLWLQMSSLSKGWVHFGRFPPFSPIPLFLGPLADHQKWGPPSRKLLWLIGLPSKPGLPHRYVFFKTNYFGLCPTSEGHSVLMPPLRYFLKKGVDT